MPDQTEHNAASDSSSIKFYRTNEEHGFLSNFWSKNPFFFEDHMVQHSEALYQALKVHRADPTLALKILTTKLPGTAAKLGREAACMREDWDLVKDDAMRLTIMVKFSEDEELLDKLVATKGRELIEDSPIDWYWGIGKDGTGKNVLGILLMEFRDWYIKARAENSTTALGFVFQERWVELKKKFAGTRGTLFAPNFNAPWRGY
jgi:ribA/ribD-fused uncharacterized protein